MPGMERATFIGVLATMLTLGFFVFLAALFFLTIPEENRDLLTTSAGILFTGTTMAWGFYLKASEAPVPAPVAPARPEEG